MIVRWIESDFTYIDMRITLYIPNLKVMIKMMKILYDILLVLKLKCMHIKSIDVVEHGFLMGMNGENLWVFSLVIRGCF